MIHKQIIIIGGGPIGLTSAISLAKLGYAVTIFDAHFQQKIHDSRVLSLSYASCNILRNIGVWDDGLATPIHQVHISHSGLGVSNIKASDMNLSELGYTIKYADLCNNLREKALENKQIEIIPSLVEKVVPGKNYATIEYGVEGKARYVTTDLVLLAEGGKIKPDNLEYREFDYRQTAIVAHIHVNARHHNTAFERFDDSGPLVLLPYQSHYVLVWARLQSDAAHLLEPKNLLSELNKLAFMKRFVSITIDKNISSFPLKLQVAKKRILERVVMLGNSAQVLHPVSAQGLNLGLRDIDALVEMLAPGHLSNLQDIQGKLAQYDKLRQKDAKLIIGFTHFLAKYLEKKSIIGGHIRGLGLIGLSNCRLLQNKLAKSLIFGA
jgi:2-octaprenyl-6-methoxyphenol hydroxylase